MPTSIVVLQRRQPSERADELLDQIQAGLAPDERIRWSADGHARLNSSQPLEDARLAVSGQFASIDEDWGKHILIL
jgi:hypothetical protein